MLLPLPIGVYIYCIPEAYGRRGPDRHHNLRINHIVADIMACAGTREASSSEVRLSPVGRLGGRWHVKVGFQHDLISMQGAHVGPVCWRANECVQVQKTRSA